MEQYENLKKLVQRAYELSGEAGGAHTPSDRVRAAIVSALLADAIKSVDVKYVLLEEPAPSK